MRALVAAALLALGCSAGTTLSTAPLDLAAGDVGVSPLDRDGDGLTDDTEAMLVAAYLPFLSIAADDACAQSGLVVRVTPSTTAPLVVLRFVWLFDRECGTAMRAGAGGSFAVVVDPRIAGAAGVVSMRAIARRGTTCELASTCGVCPGLSLCERLGGLPAIWAARDTHAIYADASSRCHQVGACIASCVDAATGVHPPIVNVGESAAPLVRDLTLDGFIRPENGWQSAVLLNHDPWGGAPFGAAAPITTMITGAAVDPPDCIP